MKYTYLLLFSIIIGVSSSSLLAQNKTKGKWVNLFNGKDLTGWKSEAKHAGDWKAANGNIIGSAKGATALLTTRDDYKDFHLRLEARYQPGCECLVFTRAPANPTRTRGTT